MKFCTIIMAFYLMFISLLPCGDTQGIVFKGREEVKISSVLAHEEDHHHADACTPFCHCACCATSVFFQPATVPTFHVFKTEAHILPFNEPFVSYNDKSIWQPPQLLRTA